MTSNYREDVGAPAVAAQTVAISLTEWKIAKRTGASIGPAKAGEVNFDVYNDGTTLHEFVVIKADAHLGRSRATLGSSTRKRPARVRAKPRTSNRARRRAPQCASSRDPTLTFVTWLVTIFPGCTGN